jgi:hypothetical protein
MGLARSSRTVGKPTRASQNGQIYGAPAHVLETTFPPHRNTSVCASVPGKVAPLLLLSSLVHKMRASLRVHLRLGLRLDILQVV